MVFDSIPFQEGLTYATLGGAIASLGSYAATQKYPGYRKNIPVSGKVGGPLMVGLFFFIWRYELKVFEIKQNPEVLDPNRKVAVPKPVSKMPIHHKIINKLYDSPFLFIGLVSAPFGGTVLYQQLQRKDVAHSMKLLQSRIYIQGGILTILLATMTFRDYMDKHGRFPEPGVVAEMVDEEEPVKLVNRDATQRGGFKA